MPEGEAPEEPVKEEEETEEAEADADEEEEVLVDEESSQIASVLKSQQGMVMVPTSQVIPPSLEDMEPSTLVPRARVSL